MHGRATQAAVSQGCSRTHNSTTLSPCLLHKAGAAITFNPSQLITPSALPSHPRRCPPTCPQARPLHLCDRPAPCGPRVALLPRRRLLQASDVPAGALLWSAHDRRRFALGVGLRCTCVVTPSWHVPLNFSIARILFSTMCYCRMADAIVINKANTAPPGSIEKLQDAAEQINPRARVRGQIAARKRAALNSGRHMCPTFRSSVFFQPAALVLPGLLLRRCT